MQFSYTHFQQKNLPTHPPPARSQRSLDYTPLLKILATPVGDGFWFIHFILTHSWSANVDVQCIHGWEGSVMYRKKKSIESPKGIMLLKDVPLRTRRVLLLNKVYGYSAPSGFQRNIVEQH